MKYEDIINKSKKVKAPDLSHQAGAVNQKHHKMGSILDLLKKIDSKTRFGIRVIQSIYIAMILIALAYIIQSSNLYINLGIGFIAVAFALVIFVQQLRYKVYTNTYTNNPVIKYLHNAKKRMRVFTPRTYYVILIWLFIDLGICLILSSILEDAAFFLSTILLVQATIIILVVIDFYVAYLLWKRDYKPVIQKIDKMIEEIEDTQS